MKTKKSNIAFSLLEFTFAAIIIAILMFAVTKGSLVIAKSKLLAAQALTENSPVHVLDDHLALWLETTLDNSLNNNERIAGSAINNWYNIKSQSSNKVFNLTPESTPPSYLSSGVGDLPTIKFNDTPLRQANILGRDLTYGNQISVFIVQKYYLPKHNSSSIRWQNNPNSIELRAIFVNNLIYFDFGTCCGNDSRISFAPPSTFGDKANIITAVRRPNNKGFVRINGEAQESSSSLTSTLNTSLLSDIVIADNMRAEISEIIIFKNGLTDSEIVSIEEYLSKKWSIKLSGI